MGSVIEHQKVERRTRVRRRLDVGPASSAPVGVGRRRSWFRRSRRGLLAAGARVRSTGRHGVNGTRSMRLGAGVRRLADPAGAMTRRAVALGASIARRVPSISSRALTVDSRDIPLLSAAIGFAIAANLMLLGLDSDRILLSGAISGITIPQERNLVVRASNSLDHDQFSVIGEVSGVDPAQFARLEVSEYVVQPGDTLGEIAAAYDLEMDTLISFNQIEDVRRLQVGETYQIPNRDGLLYTVKRGDSVASIAGANGTSINAILDANDLRSETIVEGQVLFVPEARLNLTELRIILGELFAWPTRGTFTSGFGMRDDPFTGLPRFHNGIDLANSVGTSIRAAASGRVVHVESQVGNYGRFVIVRHPDGFQTLYAHLDGFAVRTGEYVDRGEILGTMGNTGRSTGPHLHFSVIHNGTFVNPLRYLH